VTAPGCHGGKKEKGKRGGDCGLVVTEEKKRVFLFWGGNDGEGGGLTVH